MVILKTKFTLMEVFFNQKIIFDHQNDNLHSTKPSSWENLSMLAMKVFIEM